MRASLLTTTLAASAAALTLLSPAAAQAVPGHGPGGPGHHDGDYTDPGGLQPDQLVVCSHGAHSEVVIDNLTTPGDTPNPGSFLVTIPKDECRTIVTVPDGDYPIDGTYRVYLQGFKERPLACEDISVDPDCKLPFHHIEITHALKPGVTDIDQPEATVTINSLDGVRVDFVHRGDYGRADKGSGGFDH